MCARLIVAMGLVLTGCTGNKMAMDLRGAVLYAKPGIAGVSHTLVDHRIDGGRVVVSVTVLGDPRLVASFDITPGIAQRVPMTETSEGVYSGEFAFAPEIVGGPFTIVGRLSHENAGEIVRKDPEQLFVPLADRR